MVLSDNASNKGLIKRTSWKAEIGSTRQLSSVLIRRAGFCPERHFQVEAGKPEDKDDLDCSYYWSFEQLLLGIPQQQSVEQCTIQI